MAARGSGVEGSVRCHGGPIEPSRTRIARYKSGLPFTWSSVRPRYSLRIPIVASWHPPKKCTQIIKRGPAADRLPAEHLPEERQSPQPKLAAMTQQAEDRDQPQWIEAERRHAFEGQPQAARGMCTWVGPPTARGTERHARLPEPQPGNEPADEAVALGQAVQGIERARATSAGSRHCRARWETRSKPGIPGKTPREKSLLGNEPSSVSSRTVLTTS